MTTHPEPSGSRLTDQPSSSIEIEIYLFPCGHGDTILVGLPGEKWGLIDCYLPRGDGTRSDFFDFISTKRIEKLDFIFQTHPDYDHYHGMQDVIEYFLRDGRRVGYYIDTGLNAESARALLNNRPQMNEYIKLQSKLEEWAAEKLLELHELDANRYPFSPAGYRGVIDFIPIGPDPVEKRRICVQDLRRSATNSAVRTEANKLSLVIVLAVNVNDKQLNILLCADADAGAIQRGMTLWGDYAKEKGVNPEFHAIKIPHHGSIKSHTIGLCQTKWPGVGEETAVICAGTRRALPDREVLRASNTTGLRPRPGMPVAGHHPGAIIGRPRPWPSRCCPTSCGRSSSRSCRLRRPPAPRGDARRSATGRR